MNSKTESEPFSYEALSLSAEAQALADLPQTHAEVVAAFEKNRIRPTNEISCYVLDQNIEWFRYPKLVREYFNFSEVTPKSVKVTFNKEQSAVLPGISITIQCDKGIIMISVPADAKMYDTYKMTIDDDTNDFPDYILGTSEVSELLTTMVISLNHAEDINLARSEGNEISELNPRDPRIYPSLQSLLEDKADKFSHRRQYSRTVHQISDITGKLAPYADLLISVDDYHTNDRQYETTLSRQYDEPGLQQNLEITSKFQVTHEGGLNQAEVSGICYESNDDPGLTKHTITAGDCAPYLQSAIEALLKYGFDAPDPGRA